MVKNKLEKIMSPSLKLHFTFAMKLHNNPLACQNTPADYLTTLFNAKGDGTGRLGVYLIECKQVTCDPGEVGRLAFKRLKQMHDLLNFENLCPYHYSYFAIGFYDGGWTNSEIYIVPAQVMQELVLESPKLSINRTEAKTIWAKYRCSIKNGLIDFGGK